MHGTLNIRCDSALQGTPVVYQVRYEDLSGNSFAGSLNKEDLRDLLYRKLSININDHDLECDYDRLLREGRLTFPEIDLKESELAGAGLKYLPAEG